VVGFTIGSRGKVPGKTCEKRRINNNNNNNKNNNNNSFQFSSFIYVLDNSQIWQITAKHKNISTG
jgi:hypothetical protein